MSKRQHFGTQYGEDKNIVRMFWEGTAIPGEPCTAKGGKVRPIAFKNEMQVGCLVKINGDGTADIDNNARFFFGSEPPGCFLVWNVELLPGGGTCFEGDD